MSLHGIYILKGDSGLKLTGMTVAFRLFKAFHSNNYFGFIVVLKIFLFLFLASGVLLGQKKSSPIFIEHNSIKDYLQVEFISYRIPFNQLLFIKNGNAFKANFTFIFNISIHFYIFILQLNKIFLETF